MNDSLKTEEGTFETTFTEKYKNRTPWTRPNPKMIMSYIPGTITQLMVEVGTKVAKGDPLLSFNAMKMANTYASPIEGKVAKINVKEGESVPKGAVLIEFE
ncbi:MAG: acetyl-CoA carboxylase biotin carboxyl carrier protein subunit [Rikenellaceae bacterium]